GCAAGCGRPSHATAAGADCAAAGPPDAPRSPRTGETPPPLTRLASGIPGYDIPMPAQAYRGAPCVCQRRLERCDQSCVADMMSTTFYLACLKLTGRRCLVVGAGSVGLEKVEGLLACDARVHVIAPEACAEIEQLAAAGDVELSRRRFRPGDLDGHFLAIAATSDSETNIAVFEEAERRA